MSRTAIPTVVPFHEKLAPHFETLNRQWIERYFTIEDADLALFSNPFKTVIEPGGQIFFIIVEDEALGVCAVLRHDARVYELAKMAVHPQAQGRGYGDLLVKAAIEFATMAGAESLMLLTNSSLRPALRLYEKHCFRRVPLSANEDYQRADVQMELKLREMREPQSDGQVSAAET